MSELSDLFFVKLIASKNPGVRIVLAAYKDLKAGVFENPKVPNSGPRIDEMQRRAGYNFPVFWCACAVTTWWISGTFACTSKISVGSAKVPVFFPVASLISRDSDMV